MRSWGLALLLASSASAETILVVGDSHTAGPFGRALDAALRRKDLGHRVATYGVCAARPKSFLSETAHGCGHLFRDFKRKSPYKWLGKRRYTEKRERSDGKVVDVEMIMTPALTQLLDDHVPTVVIVALGSNLPISDDSVKKTLAAVHAVNAACLWVGPPDMRDPSPAEVNAVYKTLKANGVKTDATLKEARKDSCRLIDSRDFEFLAYPVKKGDGTHYEGGSLSDLGERWGADTAAAVLSILAP